MIALNIKWVRLRVTPHDFFGTAFWLGFTMHLIAAESWIDYTRLEASSTC